MYINLKSDIGDSVGSVIDKAMFIGRLNRVPVLCEFGRNGDSPPPFILRVDMSNTNAGTYEEFLKMHEEIAKLWPKFPTEIRKIFGGSLFEVARIFKVTFVKCRNLNDVLNTYEEMKKTVHYKLDKFLAY